MNVIHPFSFFGNLILSLHSSKLLFLLPGKNLKNFNDKNSGALSSPVSRNTRE